MVDTDKGIIWNLGEDVGHVTNNKFWKFSRLDSYGESITGTYLYIDFEQEL